MLRVAVADDALAISVTVANVGTRVGRESILCHGAGPSGIERWPLALKAFARASLQPGESRTLTMQVRTDDLAIATIRRINGDESRVNMRSPFGRWWRR